jgi:hypothetical protein
VSPRVPTTPPLRVVRADAEADRALATELARVPAGRGELVMVCAPAEAKRRLEEMQAFVRAAMVPGEDFMVIPGTGDKRPSLLQPGAQKLAEIYGLAHRFLELRDVEDWQAGFFYYSTRCVLTRRADGSFVGEGLGSANSKESKYGMRWVQGKDVPAWLDVATLPRKERPSKYENGKPYTVFGITNEDPYSIVNTLQKMAAKRAYVHAVLSVTRSSGLFTQDREDLPLDVYGVAEEERPWQRPAPPPAREVVVETVPFSGFVAAPIVTKVDTSPAARPSPPAPVVHRDVKPDNVSTEQSRIDHFGPRFAATKTGLEVGAVSREYITACGGIAKASPRERAWFGEALKQAQAGIGGGRK